MELPMNKYWKPILTFNFNNINLKLEVIDNTLSINPKDVFKVARRINPKRNYLFVSKLIGKHIPIHPQALKIAGALLARKWMMDRYDMKFDDIDILIEGLSNASKESDELMNNFNYPSFHCSSSLFNNSIDSALQKRFTLNEKTLFMGFAETATGLAESFFSNFTNCTLINSTRDSIVEAPYCFHFKEPHSHAVNHTIYTTEKDFFNNFDHIALIDDEITTGVTALNLIDCLPNSSFSIISILDWRSQSKLKSVTLDSKSVLYSSLLKGNIIDSSISPILEHDEIAATNFLSNKSSVEIHSINYDLLPHNHGVLLYTGKLGLESSLYNSMNEDLVNISNSLKKYRSPSNKKALCIGDEEFIYIPCFIASNLGQDVLFQSTTRSPILSCEEVNYGILNKFNLKDKNSNGFDTYIYNLPKNYYSDVFYFSEKPLTDDYKLNLKNLFSELGVSKLIFVSFS